MISNWERRPQEIAYLLNPAFCGEILWRCTKKYQETTGNGLPYALLFLVLPIVLHRRTRESLPDKAIGKLHTWLQSHQELKIGFAGRTKQLIEITKEALSFISQKELIEFDEDANVFVLKRKQKRISVLENGEVHQCFRKAEILGSILGRSGTSTTIFATWGVKP